MPLYYFHIADGVRDPDRDGTEFPGNAAAGKPAIRFAGAVMHDEPDVLWNGRGYRVEGYERKGEP